MNRRIHRGLRSQGEGATGWPWMWRRRRYYPSPCVETLEPGSTRLASPNRNSRTLVRFFLFTVLFKFFFKNVKTRIFDPTRMVDPNRSLVYSNRFYLSYQNVLFMSFHFKVLIYTEAFSNSRPINIYIYTNTFILRHSMPLQNDIQNISSKFNSFVYKMSHVKKEMICIWRGIYLYTVTLSMTLRFLFLAFFPVH